MSDEVVGIYIKHGFGEGALDVMHIYMRREDGSEYWRDATPDEVRKRQREYPASRLVAPAA